MVLDSKKANEMQSAVDCAFASLPRALKTDEIKTEIAKVVASSSGSYLDAAQNFASQLVKSVDAVNEKLAGLRSR